MGVSSQTASVSSVRQRVKTQMTTSSLHVRPYEKPGAVARTTDLCEEDEKKNNILWRCPKCTLANAKSAAVCELCETPQPNTHGEATEPWKCHGCYLENAHAADACTRCDRRRPKTWRCLVCGAKTTSPLSLPDAECPHKACALHCLQQLHPGWVEIKAELRSLKAELPQPKRHKTELHEGDKAQ